MTQAAPRLSGPRVALVPVPRDVTACLLGDARAGLDAALAAHGLRRADGWPHADTAGALRASPAWLLVVDGSVVGECGWTSAPDRDGVVDIAYGIAPPSRGSGIGTEAVATLAAWTLAQPGVDRVAADVLRANDASRRLLRRLGFVEHAHDATWMRAVLGADTRVRGRHVC